MRTYTTIAAAASFVLGLGAVSIVPASAASVDQAQCANARGSGDLNDIRLFCNRSDLPSTAVRPGKIVRGFFFNNSSGRDVGNANMSLRQMNCNQAKAENSQANIAFFC